MAAITRRDFVLRAAGGLTALGAGQMAASTDAQQIRTSNGTNGALLKAAAIRALASKFAGQIITPDASDHESARLLFNRAFDRRPALIARCAVAADIARTLNFAQQYALPVAVRGGGHNRAGFSSCDGGVVIDMSAMNRVEVDSKRRVAAAQSGALTVDLDAATQRFALATTSAGCPTVGIAGLTLGGEARVC